MSTDEELYGPVVAQQSVGFIFGDLAIEGNKPRAATVVCTTELCDVIIFDAPALKTIRQSAGRGHWNLLLATPPARRSEHEWAQLRALARSVAFLSHLHAEIVQVSLRQGSILVCRQ